MSLFGVNGRAFPRAQGSAQALPEDGGLELRSERSMATCRHGSTYRILLVGGLEYEFL